jgi:hypothetical protein
MGQTEPGSYVVTAYAPPLQRFFEREAQKKDARQSLAGSHTGREVVEVMSGALQVTREVVDVYRQNNHVEEFDEAVEHGLSRELALAVQRLVDQSDGAAVSVEWNTSISQEDVGIVDFSPRTGVTEIEFSPSDYEILGQAAVRLGSVKDSSDVTVTGSVEVLTRRVGTVGIVALNVLSGSPAKKLRVRLPPSDYEIALEAHRRMEAVRVTGRQERSGNFWWLYEPRDIELIELYRDRRAPQGDLFE